MATDLKPTELFFDQYRLTTAAGGTPMEIGRNGPAITYRASDQKSGAPVALTIVPIQAVDPAEREHFEEKARTAMLLDGYPSRGRKAVEARIPFGSLADLLAMAKVVVFLVGDFDVNGGLYMP